MNLFSVFVLTVIVSSIFALLFYFINIPSLISYIFAGFFLSRLNLLATEFISILGELGIIFLLFLVGLRLDFNKFKEFSKEVIYLGLGQVIFTSFLGVIIGILLGIDLFNAIILGLAFSFSSTIIITKILIDKNDLDTLYGRLSLGMLLIQDLIAIILLIFLSLFHFKNFHSVNLLDLVFILISFLFLFLLGKFISKFFFKIKNNPELIFLISLSWLLLFILIAKLKNFSIEAAAILAGISLSQSYVLVEITKKFTPIKDLFLIFFFVYLGSKMFIDYKVTLFALIYSVFILIANPLIVFYILNLMKYPTRLAFNTGLTTAQISEFSLILVQAFSKDYISLTSIVGMITFLISSLMIYNSQKIYNSLKKFLKFIEIIKTEEQEEKELKDHIIVVGFHRMGYIIVHKLIEKYKNILVIDFDPKAIKLLKKENINYIFGDIMDDEILSKACVSKSKLIISTIPHNEENLFLLEKFKNSNIPIILTANNAFDALNYYKLGAFYVIIPHFLGGEKAGEFIIEILNKLDDKEITEKHKKYLENKISLEHL